jgi:hypothetical protein
MNKISDDLGTAVNVQAMVFGNMGETSGTGVGFTRNPSTGTKEFYGEFLMNAQGEDVVAGVLSKCPPPASKMGAVPRRGRPGAVARHLEQVAHGLVAADTSDAPGQHLGHPPGDDRIASPLHVRPGAGGVDVDEQVPPVLGRTKAARFRSSLVSDRS